MDTPLTIRLEDLINGIPIVGHVKGVVHFARHDPDGGKRALSAATRSLIVVGSGFSAKQVGGVIGAAGAGLFAGVGYDFFVSMFNEKPFGFFAVLKNANNNPSNQNVFAAAVIPLGDAIGGSISSSFGVPYPDINDLLRITAVSFLNSLSPPVFLDKEEPIPPAVVPQVSLTAYEENEEIAQPVIYDAPEASPSPTFSDPNDSLINGSSNDSVVNSGDMNAETVMGFITSRVKMSDPYSNKTIYPLVTIINLPESHFEFTGVVKVNNVQRGVLNLIFRQSAELERVLENFSIDRFPAAVKSLVRQLQTAPESRAKALLNELDRHATHDEHLKQLLTEMQLNVLEFLHEYIIEENYVGELVDNRGRTRSVWKIFNKNQGEEAMVTPFGSAVYAPTTEIKRKFREIVGFSFAPLPDVMSKMKKLVMACDWSSTSGSSCNGYLP
uniref:PX domain-containing protein n=1 Tax=Panagrellus redivivus TaxID=6233 RepID=A0A7E4V2T8_PANRE